MALRQRLKQTNAAAASPATAPPAMTAIASDEFGSDESVCCSAQQKVGCSPYAGGGHRHRQCAVVWKATESHAIEQSKATAQCERGSREVGATGDEQGSSPGATMHGQLRTDWARCDGVRTSNSIGKLGAYDSTGASDSFTLRGLPGRSGLNRHHRHTNACWCRRHEKAQGLEQFISPEAYSCTGRT